MNVAEQMGYKVPTTFAEQARGKIAFLTKLRDSHMRLVGDLTLKAKDRVFQAQLARKADASIKFLQAKLDAA